MRYHTFLSGLFTIKLYVKCTALQFEAVSPSQQLWRVAILLVQGDPASHATSITRAETSHEAPKTWRCTLIYEPGAKPVAETRRAWPWFALHVLRNRKWATPQRCSYHTKRQIFALQPNGKAAGGTGSGRSLSTGRLLESAYTLISSRCFNAKEPTM
jgi:hypothetical protein